MPKSPDPLLSGKVVTSSVGFPSGLWKAVDEEVDQDEWKSRSAFLTALVVEAIHDIREARARAKLAELTAQAKK